MSSTGEQDQGPTPQPPDHVQDRALHARLIARLGGIGQIIGDVQQRGAGEVERRAQRFGAGVFEAKPPLDVIE